MSDVSPYRAVGGRGTASNQQGTNLADILDRVLDKGLVIAGDISISLAQVELITIKIRLLLASADKAREMGIDWWTRDPALSGGAGGGGGGKAPEDMDEDELVAQNRALLARVAQLEQQLTTMVGLPRSEASKPEPVNIMRDLAKPDRTVPPTAGRTPVTDQAEDVPDDSDGGDEGEQ